MTSLKVTSSADATNNNDAHFPEGPVVTVDWLSHNLDRDDVIVLCATMEDDEIARQAGIPGHFSLTWKEISQIHIPSFHTPRHQIWWVC